MKTADITIKTETGLHARPATAFVNKAKEFECNITVEIDGKTADAKRFLSVLSLGVIMGDAITVRAEGSDENEAITALAKLIKEDFHG